MGFLESLRKVLGGRGSGSEGGGGGGSNFGDEAGVYWIYAQCRQCGEPLRSRVNLYADLSLAEDGKTWIVRKGVIGRGENLCFQTIEVTLHFNPKKTEVTNAEIVGGRLITAEEYQALQAARNQ